jgi:hypothetical protein
MVDTAIVKKYIPVSSRLWGVIQGFATCMDIWFLGLVGQVIWDRLFNSSPYVFIYCTSPLLAISRVL